MTSRSDVATRAPAAGPAVPAGPEGLRLAVFSDAVPGRNGVGTYYDDLVRHLEDHFERVVMVTPPLEDDGSAPLKSIPMPGDPTQRLYLPPARRIWKQMHELSPHVIVSATPGAFGSLGMFIAGRIGAGFCVGYHTQIDQLAKLYWKRSLGPAFRSVLGAWDRVMFRRSRYVLVHNERLLEEVVEAGVRHVRLVGTPTPKPFLAEPLTPPSKEIGTVVFIGRLAPEKRLEQVAEAARAFPSVRFRIAGDGPLRPEVETWARERANVEALGWVERSDVLRVLDEADLLVLPSRYETFGSIALEAMARRKLAIVSPHCGISRWPELAEGLVLMQGDERLSSTIARVRSMSSPCREALTARAREAAVALNERTISDWVRVCATAGRAGVT